MFEKIRLKEGWLWRTYTKADELADKMDDHHLFMLASGIAFNISLYIIPMFLVAIYLVNIFVDAEYMAKVIEKALTDFMPPTMSSTELIHTVIEEVKKINLHSSLAGWIGIVSLLWISSTLISSFRAALNAIFEISAKKIFIFYRMTDILLTIVLTILMLVFSYFVPLVNFVLSFLEQFIPEIIHGFVSNAVLMGLSLGTSFALFFFIYFFVPTKRLPLFVSFYSTVLCVVMIEISRNIFAWYISGFANYGKFYGTYAVIISMAVWIYYSSFILLASAEIVNFIYKKRKEKKEMEEMKQFDIAEESEPHSDAEVS